MTRKIWLFIGTILLCYQSAVAENLLNPIVVGSSVSPVDIHSSPSSLEVITSEEIKQRGYRDIPEVLNSLSSINISSVGGFGQTTSIFTRGTESNHTKIILDGVELNPGTLGLAPIQNMSISTVDKIEVIKGSSSALYGANTIGGVINIITKEKAKSLEVSFGSWSTNTTSFLTGIDKNDFNIQLSVNRKETKSLPAKISSSKRHSFNTENLLLNLKRKINNYEYSSKFYISNGNTQYDSFGSNLNQNHDDYFYTIGTKMFIGDNILDINYVKSQNKITQASPAATDFTKTLRDKYDVSYTYLNKRHITEYEITYTKEHMSELSYGTRYVTDPIVKEYSFRSDYFMNSSLLNYGLRLTNHSQFGNFTSGNLGISFLTSSDVYSINFNKAFRAPDATDLYGYGGNANLLPEESYSYELSIKKLLKKDTMVRGTIFKTNIKNLIEFDSSSVQYVAKSKITGFEFIYQISRLPVSFDISYTYMVPKDISNNQYLSKRSKHKLNTNLNYSINNKHRINLSLIGEGSKKASPFSDVELGSYFIVDTNYIVNINNSSVKLSLKNLFDKSYRTSHDYNSPDRSFFVTYSYNY